MAIRKKQEPDEYQKALRKFHKKSNRHVVVFEADISEDEKRRIFSDADHLRKCGNELLGMFCCEDHMPQHTSSFQRPSNPHDILPLLNVHVHFERYVPSRTGRN